MKQNIRQSTWMNDEVKNLAIEKIDAMTKFIGYTKSYSDDNIDNYYSEVTTLTHSMREVMARSHLRLWIFDIYY